MHDITVKRVIAAVGLVLAAIAFLGAVTTGFASPAWVLPSAVLCLAAVLEPPLTAARAGSPAAALR